MFKFLLILLFFYLLIGYIRRQITGNRAKQTPLRKGDDSSIQRIVPCPTCGTYNPVDHALEKKGQFYCNEKCFKDSHK